MQPFTFHTPTKISFGEDTAGGVGDALFEFGATRPLLITDANLIKAGVLAPILEALRSAGLADPIIFDQVPSDSDLTCVRNAAQLARASKCDSIIAVGGGSVMDTGKVANIGLSLDGDVLEFEGMNTLSARLLPLIAIPTTAGTGSEVSAVAMIKNHEEHKKLLFGSRYLFPDVAVLDPKLLLSLPPRLTAATGLDALTHAIESYTAMTKNAPSDGLCLESMRLIMANLPRATKHGDDIEARSATLVGSMMAGVSFTNAGVGIVHALAHSFGAKFGTHHGITNAVFLPHGMRFNLEEVEDKFRSAYMYLSTSLRKEDKPASDWFPTPTSKSEFDNAASALITAVEQLIGECGLPSKLSEIGVPPLSDADVEELADMSQNDPAIMFNARPASNEDLAAIIRGAY